MHVNHKCQDAPGYHWHFSSALLFHASTGKQFAHFWMQQLRHVLKGSSSNGHPALSCLKYKCLERKGKDRPNCPCRSPALSPLPVNPRSGSYWWVCTSTEGTCTSLQLGILCLPMPAERDISAWSTSEKSCYLQQGRNCSWHPRTSLTHWSS